MADQYTCTEARTTAKGREGSRTDPWESLGSASKEASEGQGAGFREWVPQGRAKDDIFHPTERTGWISLVPIKEVMLSLDVGPSFVLRS